MKLDAKTGAVIHADQLGAFDAVKVAAYYWKSGLGFEYLPQSWMEGLRMSTRSNPSQPRAL